MVPALVRLLSAQVAPKGSSSSGQQAGQGGVPADRLVLSVLTLLFNLSFDAACREQMVKASLIPKLVEMLAEGRNRRAILLLLYHMSSEGRIRKLFTYTEVMPNLRSYPHLPACLPACLPTCLRIRIPIDRCTS